MSQEPFIHPHLMRTLAVKDVIFDSGAGSLLHGVMPDATRKAFLDFFTDVGTSSLGYCSPEYKAVLEKLLDGCIPAHAPNLYRFSERDAASEGLCKLTGFDKVFFCNSGAEAVEAAIKLTRKWHHDQGSDKREIWTCKDGFHGRTGFALAAGDGPPYHYVGFDPLPRGFVHFTDLKEINWDNCAAVMLAPVFGNNDVRVYPDGWLENLRQECSEHGALLIFDEVQTGSGRTGAPTYGQLRGVKADIMTLAKGIAMGAPVGAMLATEEVAQAFTPGCHFSTFGGNPLSCAFVNGMTRWIENEGNLKDVQAKGKYMVCRFGELGWAKDVRGVGMLIAFDFMLDGLDFAARCLDRGLLIGAFRPGAGPIKITPPLNIDMAVLDQGIEIMDAVHKEMVKG